MEKPGSIAAGRFSVSQSIDQLGTQRSRLRGDSDGLKPRATRRFNDVPADEKDRLMNGQLLSRDAVKRKADGKKTRFSAGSAGVPLVPAVFALKTLAPMATDLPG